MQMIIADGGGRFFKEVKKVISYGDGTYSREPAMIILERRGSYWQLSFGMKDRHMTEDEQKSVIEPIVAELGAMHRIFPPNESYISGIGDEGLPYLYHWFTPPEWRDKPVAFMDAEVTRGNVIDHAGRHREYWDEG